MIEQAIKIMKSAPTRAEMYLAIVLVSAAVSTCVVVSHVEPQIEEAMKPMLDRLDTAVERLNNVEIPHGPVQRVDIGLDGERSQIVREVLKNQNYIGEN